MVNSDDVVYLQLQLQKGAYSTDTNGDFVFDAEASNENLDLEEQKILQQTLLNSKDYFITNGVISKDHLHRQIVGDADNRHTIFCEEFIIGEPLKVYIKDGNKTYVKGKLYKNNPHAKKFIDLLNARSTRVKASVGGLLPIVKKNELTGESEVIKFLWDDLALTVAPVNHTVSPVQIGKSLSSSEFIKALSAGSGTDSNQLTGGRALIPEDVGSSIDTKIITKLVGAILDGEIRSKDEAEYYLNNSLGLDKNTAKKYMATVFENQKDIMEVLPMEKGKEWEEALKQMQKSFGGNPSSANGSAANTTDTNTETEEFLEVPSLGESADDITKSLDAGIALSTLTDDVKTLKESNEILSKAVNQLLETNSKILENQATIGKSLSLTMQAVDEFSENPLPRASAVKAVQGGISKSISSSSGKIMHKQFTPSTKDEAMGILTKAVADGELTIVECGKIETQINKSLHNPSYQLDQKYVSFLQKKMAK